MQPSLVKKAITGSAIVAGVMFVQPDGAEAAFGDQELKKGMNNQDVKELQDVLKAKGYFTYHTSTGYYGPITEDAVGKFQQAVGLNVTGVATTDTLKALGAKSVSKSSQHTSSLQVGSRGQQVTNLQTALKDKGYYSYNVDGIYGQITQKAVQDFQREEGLSVTGKADATTINALSKSSASSSKPSSSSSDISIGMRGSAVTDLQSKLQSKGYYNYKVDGIFGKITKTAVQNFQKSAGLSQTGVADRKTLAALSEKETAKPESSVTGLSIGSRGSSVTSLQQMLKDRGYYNDSIDGIFGNNTHKAVKEFQSIVGLPVTGVADDKTIDTLKSRSNQQTETVLKVGSKGNAVTELQNKLKKAGTFHVEATGYYGPVTEKAVKDFQKAKKLQVTGTATKETMDALDGSTDKVVTTPSTGEDQGDLLKKGSTGSLVKELQSKLKAIGLYSGPLDGDFGNGTDAAVRAFQSRNKLTVDGVVGPATWEKLKQSTGYEGNGNTGSDNGTSNSSFSVMDLIADASVYIGVPYVWGGNTPTQGFDCSGFLVYVFKKQGISLPRTMAQMWNVTTPVSSPSVGDIVYFTTYKPGASHGGIYIGNNKFIHAGSSTGVTISDMNSSYWGPRYLGAKRAH